MRAHQRIELRYPLRPGFEAQIVIPAGMTLEEVDRLSRLLHLYALPPDHFAPPATAASMEAQQGMADSPDIVARLSKSADEMGCFPHPDCGHLDRAEHAMRDAAAEIRRLRSELALHKVAEFGQLQEALEQNAALRSELEAAKKDAEVVHIGWMTAESYRRLIDGGNDSRGTVPIHVRKSSTSYIAVYIGRDQEPRTRFEAAIDAEMAKG